MRYTDDETYSCYHVNISLTEYYQEKGSDYKDNIRDFFKLIYEVVFGQENGPRLGSFTKIYTKDKTIELINSKLDV